MNLTDHIINVALLGTATRELITTDFPEELQETLRDIQAKAEDAEALFYQQSALGFAFARAGVEAQSIAGVVNVTEAPKDKPYFLREVGELLTSLYLNKNQYLLLYAYRRAADKRKIDPSCLSANFIAEELLTGIIPTGMRNSTGCLCWQGKEDVGFFRKWDFLYGENPATKLGKLPLTKNGNEC